MCTADSKEAAVRSGPSPGYQEWLRREWRGRIVVRAAQLAVVLVLW
jgi:hypothetical protein